MRTFYNHSVVIQPPIFDKLFKKIKLNKIFALALLLFCITAFYLILYYTDSVQSWIAPPTRWGGLHAIGFGLALLLTLLTGNLLLCYLLGNAWSWALVYGIMLFLAPIFIWNSGKSSTFVSPAIRIFEQLSISNIELTEIVNAKTQQRNVIPILNYRNGSRDIVAECKQGFPILTKMGASISLVDDALVLHGIPYSTGINQQLYRENANQLMECIAKARL